MSFPYLFRAIPQSDGSFAASEFLQGGNKYTSAEETLAHIMATDGRSYITQAKQRFIDAVKDGATVMVYLQAGARELERKEVPPQVVTYEWVECT